MMMLLYPITLAASIIFLAAWFYFQERKVISTILRTLFFVAFAGYGVALLMNGGDMADKWGILVKDLMIMAGVPVILTVFKTRRWAYFIMMGIAAFLISKYLQNNINALQAMSEPAQEWELLVEVKEDHQFKELDKLVDQYGLQYQKAFTVGNGAITDLDDYYVVEIPENFEAKIDKISADLMASGLVDWVEPNETIKISPIEAQRVSPINRKFGINDPGLKQLWGFEYMKVDQLYEMINKQGLKPKKVAKIAILDTGVDAKHEDLKGQFFSTKAKYNKDVRGHGTHCAGIAAAVSNNNVGIASFSPSKGFVKVTSIKVLSDYGFGSQRDIINGIIEAADKGMDVISMSLGGRSNQSRQRAYEQAVSYANKAGAIVVAAAGNEGANAKNVSPANANGLITVSALDTVGRKASFSNTVQDVKMGIAAPGVAIYSTVPDSKYATYNGTSMATPYVAGLLGLMRSFDPELNTEEAYRILKSTGISTPTPKLTGQVIQPAAALKALLER